MKIALVHEWLINLAGSEKVLEAIYELYPSTIYTLIKDYKKLKNTCFENADIKTSFIQNLPKSINMYKNYLPLFPIAIEQFDLSDYNIVISSSHCVAKGVLTNQEQIHICYCHTPVRYAWDLYHEYLSESNLNNKSIKSIIARMILHYIRLWDYSSSNRPDYYISNSKYISERIKKVYNKESTVIYPPVDTHKFELYEKKEDFYLTVSRIAPYKKIDLLVETFNNLPEKKLIVIGDGEDLNKIKSKANKNIEILGYQSFDIVKDYMQRAKAFIYAAKEDFGIAPVEAQSCGTPVIAYKKGGVLETVIENKTGIFFEEQTTRSIINSINLFEKLEFNYNNIRIHSEKFSKSRFQKEFQENINNIINKKYT